MTQTEALKLALQLVSNLRTHSWTVADEQLVITAIKEALAQPEQKQNSTCNNTLRAEGKGYPRTCKKCGKGPCIADRVQPEQEPVAWMNPDGRVWTFGRGFDKSTFTIPLYTTPPQRKPLTDEEILAVARDHYNPHQRSEVSFARAIEAAHGIKGEV